MSGVSTANRAATLWLAALGLALLLLLSSGQGSRARAATLASPVPVTARALAFHEAMDRLWEDHVTWTRMVIVGFAAGSPDLKAAETRLLRNQSDIGNAIEPFYGAAAGQALTRLLRTHILEAVPVLAAAKAGDQAKLKSSLAAWYANANQIAAFLNKANPSNWPLAAMQTMMKKHLALTTAEAVARLQGSWQADVAAYDRVHAEILQMAGMLADGIIAQFPDRFA